MRILSKLINNNSECGNAIIELAIVLPVLLLCTCWSIELVEEINAYNQAVSISKEAAMYAFRECSNKKDVQSSTCLARIDNEMSYFASRYDKKLNRNIQGQKGYLSPTQVFGDSHNDPAFTNKIGATNPEIETKYRGRSHVAISVYYKENGAIREYHASTHGASFPEARSNGLIFSGNCKDQGAYFDSDVNKQSDVRDIFGANAAVSSVVVAQAYIYYEPMFGGLAKLVGVDVQPKFICDTTII